MDIRVGTLLMWRYVYLHDILYETNGRPMILPFGVHLKNEVQRMCPISNKVS